MSTQTPIKNNGHTDQAIPGIPMDQIPDEVKAILGLDSFKGAFTNQNMSTALEKLVDPGEKTKDLIMRAHYWDFDYKTAWMCLLWLAKHFHDNELEELLMNTAAGDTSVGGYRIELMVQAVIGQRDQERKKSVGDRLRNWAGMGKNKND